MFSVRWIPAAPCPGGGRGKRRRKGVKN